MCWWYRTGGTVLCSCIGGTEQVELFFVRVLVVQNRRNCALFVYWWYRTGGTVLCSRIGGTEQAELCFVRVLVVQSRWNCALFVYWRYRTGGTEQLDITVL